MSIKGQEELTSYCCQRGKGMVPPDFTVYFTTIATVEATLFGLIFVAISIAPERVAVTSAPLERQVKAFAAYNALLNPLIISLFALVPHQQIGFVILPLGLIGIIQTLIMTLAFFLPKNKE
jgi:hypothetical protein